MSEIGPDAAGSHAVGPDGAAARRPGPESTLADVRARLVNDGVAVLERLGVDIGLDHIRLADVIASTGVSRSTAYRSLADDDLAPQEVLHRDVLAQILRRDARQRNLSLVGDAVGIELERQQANLESGDPDRRMYAVRSVIRVGCEASYRGVVVSTERAVLIASYGALRSSVEHDWRHDEVIDGERELATLFSELYIGLSSLFGYRLRPHMQIEKFSTAVASLLEGLAMRDGFSEHLDHIERPTGLDGEIEEWTLFGIAFEGIYGVFFEPGPVEPR